jgi:adenosylcobyric acid synthase
MRTGKKASALMVQGTCSGAGKSLLVAGLARVFARDGVKVAPFKSQNMALNSFITKEGAEIGRAQALQAEACFLEPEPEMNPVLLKAQGQKGCQVILNGKVHSNMSARQYYAFKDEAWNYVVKAYDDLRSRYDLILIEGAGSPAEINLRKEEIVNMRVARHANSPVVLVGDIERGGVFASFYGTVKLLDEDSELIKAFVINKFRGDKGILDPGLEQIREKTGIPVAGVIPHLDNLGLEEEDGLALTGIRHMPEGKRLKVVVVRVGYISNFTDFDPFKYEPDVELIYSTNSSDIETADIVIIPGSKNTVLDLMQLRVSGVEESIKRAAANGVMVIGVCGGYQMLGKRILDPDHVESPEDEINGIGLLDIETIFRGQKVTTQTEASTGLYGFKGKLRGYEIHMGETSGDTGAFSLDRFSSGACVDDGSQKGNVWGTYLHGVFDTDGFRAAVLDHVREEKGIDIPEERVSFSEIKEKNLDRWAEFLIEHLDMECIRGLYD